MYQFLKSFGTKKFLLSEALSLAIALLLSEMLYKFGSFLLECGAFLITWFVLSWIATHFSASKNEPGIK